MSAKIKQNTGERITQLATEFAEGRWSESNAEALLIDLEAAGYKRGVEACAVAIEGQAVHSDFSLMRPDGDTKMAAKLRRMARR